MIPWHWFFYLGLLLIHGRALLTETHAPKLDERAAVRTIALCHQSEPEAGPDAWPIVAEAARIVREIESAERSKLDPDGDIFFDFTSLLPTPTDATEEEQTQFDAQRLIAARALAEARRRGVFELLAPAADAPRSPPAEAADSKGPNHASPLSSLRQLTRLSVARMYDAANRGDWDDHAAAARDIHALARIASQQTTVIGRLVAISCASKALEETRATFLEHPHLPEQVLLRLAADLEAQQRLWPPRNSGVESDHAEIICLLQLMFTDDGNGGGYPILSLVAAFTTFPFGTLNKSDQRDWYDMALANLLGVTLAPKAKTFAAIDSYYDRLSRIAHLDRPARTSGLSDLTAWIGSMPPSHAVTCLLLETFAPAHAKWLEYEDNHRLNLLGTRIMLALELYHRRHHRYPDTLGALIPAFLPELPAVDPVSGHPLIYKPLDPATDPHHRPYLLYSRGHDRTDNGGNAHKHNWAPLTPSPLSGWSDGFDYIINAPRSK